MSKFSEHYSRALKFSRENWELFRRRLEAEPHHRWGGPEADHNLRAVAADAYQEATDDEHGAELLRTPGTHVIVDGGGKVHRGKFNHRPVEQALSLVSRRLEDWANHETPTGSGAYLQFPGTDGTVGVTEYTTPAVVRDTSGNGRLDPTPAEAAATPDIRSRVHHSKLGQHLADRVSNTLERDLGWNKRWQNSQYDEGLWNEHRERAEAAIEQLRQAPFEEIVPEQESR